MDGDAERAEAVAAALAADGCKVVGVVPDTGDLVRAVRETEAEVIVCDFDAPSRDSIESMRALNRDEPRPVVMFVDRSEPGAIAEAMEAGVAAYVIEGLSPSRVRGVIDVAVARFVAFQGVKDELAQARAALNDRALLDRAKAVLMATRGMNEADAHLGLRKLAMNQGRRVLDVAASVVAGEELPWPGRRSPKK